jgi:hypothetical protein
MWEGRFAETPQAFVASMEELALNGICSERTMLWERLGIHGGPVSPQMRGRRRVSHDFTVLMLVRAAVGTLQLIGQEQTPIARFGTK